MAGRILCVTNILQKSFRSLTISKQLPLSIAKCEQLQPTLLKYQTPIIDSVRHASFFNKLTAEQIWKGCTSVSNAGMKRGRGQKINKRNIRNLNRGQYIGQGKANMVWPGLNAPVIRGTELVKQEKLPEDKEWSEKLFKIRDSQRTAKRFKLPAEDRGWSGVKMPGRSVGEPDPIGDYEFEGFDSRVLELKLVVVMSGNLGRRRRQSAFVVTGNGNGMGGFAVGKAIDGKGAVRKAKNRAAQKLVDIPISEGHTVYHDFYCRFGDTQIVVNRKPEGYGLVCHRAIKTICQTIGIKDLHAKIRGSTNVQHVTKAFFLGLMQQKTYQQLADEKGLHLVQSSEDRDYYPVLLASPKECRKDSDISPQENLDFNAHVMNGRIILKKKKPKPFYSEFPSYKLYLQRHEKKRSHDKTKFDLIVKYGELISHLTDKHPECVPGGSTRPTPKYKLKI